MTILAGTEISAQYAPGARARSMSTPRMESMTALCPSAAESLIKHGGQGRKGG